VKLVKLSLFAGMPLRPSIQGLEFSTSEVAECTFSLSDGLGL
jgi:hypothetical protein